MTFSSNIKGKVKSLKACEYLFVADKHRFYGEIYSCIAYKEIL